MSVHSVVGEWRVAKAAALTARATAIGDTLDHLTDIEDMLSSDGIAGSENGEVTRDIRTLASRLRSLRSEYESEAAKAGA